MNNEYEVAAVIELGSARDVVLGQKVNELALDAQTGEFNMKYIEATED